METTTQTTDSKKSTLTEQSLKLFLALAADAGNWDGNSMISISKEERGNLTQIKRAKLLTTFNSDGCQFVEFTPKGAEFAKTHGIDLSDWVK